MWYSMQIFTNIFMIGLISFPTIIVAYVRAFFSKIIPSSLKRKVNITDKTILITGAGSGVGRQLAIEFSKLSTSLVLVDINNFSLLDTEKLMDRSSRVFVYQCDVSKREAVYKMATTVEGEVGKVDILINNAGIVNGKFFLDLSDEGIEKTFAVNTLAHFWMCKAFLPSMVKNNQGHIVSVSSMVGFGGLPKLTDYTASKYAAVGFAETLSLEIFKQDLNVKVTTICPTLITSGLFEGAKEPFSVSVTPEYAASKIVSVVLEGREGVVCIPEIMYLLILLSPLLPQSMVKKLYKCSGLLNFMDTYQGRK